MRALTMLVLGLFAIVNFGFTHWNAHPESGSRHAETVAIGIASPCSNHLANDVPLAAIAHLIRTTNRLASYRPTQYGLLERRPVVCAFHRDGAGGGSSGFYASLDPSLDRLVRLRI